MFRLEGELRMGFVQTLARLLFFWRRSSPRPDQSDTKPSLPRNDALPLGTPTNGRPQGESLPTPLQKKKSQTHRIIQILKDQGYLEYVGGYKNKGFLYKIIDLEKEKSVSKTVSKTTNTNTIFEEIQGEFNDNQNIDYQYRKDNFRF